MWFCPECGNKNDDAFRFCAVCGIERPDAKADIPVSNDILSDEDYTKKEPIKKDREPKSGSGFKVPLWAIITAAAVIVAVVLLLVLGVFSSADSLKEKGDNALAKEDYKSAYSYYEKYAKKADLSNKETDELLLEPRLGLAEAAVDAEKWDDALEYLDKCSGKEADKLLDRCNAGLAEVAIENGDWNEARDLLEGNSAPEAKDLIKQCDYHFGVEAMEKEDWEKAAELFEGLSYLDSEDLLEQCENQLGPDKAFLAALSEGLVSYMAADKGSISARYSAVQEIQNRISEYEGQQFRDAALGDLAASVIENINSQASQGEQMVADTIYYRSYQKTIWQNMVDLCGYLADLNSQYGLLEGNSDFKATFIDSQSTWQSQLSYIKAFDKDYSSYRSRYSASGWGGSTQQFIKYTNDTGKFYSSVTFIFYLYKNSKYISTSRTTMEVPIGKQIRIYFDCEYGKVDSWDWDWYINF